MRRSFSAVVLIPALVVSFLAIASCGTTDAALDAITDLYRHEAAIETRNPVIVLHGILGARLAERGTERVVWGAFTGDAAQPGTPEGARLIAVPLDEPKDRRRPYDPDRERVYATGPLEALQVGFLFTVIPVKVYAQIIKSLGAGGYTDPVLFDPRGPRYADEHYTCYTFFYDWRRDCMENAVLLGRYIEARRKQIMTNATRKANELRATGDPALVARADRLDAWLAHGFKFDIVAHSMGGLIARYYLRYGANLLPDSDTPPPVTWAGAKDVDRLILVGTPNLGSMHSFKELNEGSQLSLFAPYYNPVILGSMPAVYQLLPRPRHGPFVDEQGRPLDIDVYDPAVWEQNGWGLMGEGADAWIHDLRPDLADKAARKSAARAHLGWCLQRAKRLHRALDQVPRAACPTEIDLFAADTHPTLARVMLRRDGGRLRPDFTAGDILLERGDQAVPRYSALADERQDRLFRVGALSAVPWTSVTFLDDDHIGLTRNALFTNNLLFTLLQRTPPSRVQH